jgi:hypothetical protein
MSNSPPGWRASLAQPPKVAEAEPFGDPLPEPRENTTVTIHNHYMSGTYVFRSGRWVKLLKGNQE